MATLHRYKRGHTPQIQKGLKRPTLAWNKTKCSLLQSLCLSAELRISVSQVDVSNPLAYIMAPKEESEVKTIQRACMVTTDVFNKYLKDQIMEVIDADKVDIDCNNICFASGSCEL